MGCPANNNKKIIVRPNRKRLVFVDEKAFIAIQLSPVSDGLKRQITLMNESSIAALET
jgi:hypothetical protein